MQPRMISKKEFFDLLRKGKGRIETPGIVNFDVFIAGDVIQCDDLLLSNILFNECVEVCRGTGEQLNPKFIRAMGCTFMKGLTIRSISTGAIYIDHVTASNLTVYSCDAERLHISATQIKRIDIAGINLSGKLTLKDVELEELELSCDTSEDRVRTAHVITNNLLAAEQFRFAGIPVFVNTATARQSLLGNLESARKAA